MKVKYFCDSAEASTRLLRIVDSIVGCYGVKNKTNNNVVVTMRNNFGEDSADEIYSLYRDHIDTGVKMLGLSKLIRVRTDRFFV